MPEFEITISSTFTIEFDETPDDDDVISDCRLDPGILLASMEVDSIDEV